MASQSFILAAHDIIADNVDDSLSDDKGTLAPMQAERHRTFARMPRQRFELKLPLKIPSRSTPLPTIRTTSRPMMILVSGITGVHGGRERVLGTEDLTVPSPGRASTDFTVPRKIVTITTADDQEFQVHSNFLCNKSQFFSAAFQGGFAEAGAASMELRDVDPKIFGLLVHWCYVREIALDHFLVDDSNIALMPLAKLWTLANRFIMPELEKVVMDVLKATKITVNGSDEAEALLSGFIDYAYEPALDRTDLKTFVVNMLVQHKHVSGTEVKLWADRFPEGLLLDLAMAMKDELCALNMDD